MTVPPSARPPAGGPSTVPHTDDDTVGADSAALFKRGLRDVFAAGRFSSLAALERASGLSHDTVSRALSPNRPLPSARTVRILTTTMDLPPEPWLRRLAQLTDPAPPPPAVVEPEPEPEPEPAPPVRARRRRVLAAVAVAVLVVAGVLVAVLVRGSDDPAEVRIVSPQGSVGMVTTVRGTVAGLRGHNLWLDVQSVTEQRHHFTEQPCTRTGDRFVFEPLFVGRASESGDQFRITVVATAKDGPADQALVAYAERPKTDPDAYAGLPAMPTGARPVASVIVVRK